MVGKMRHFSFVSHFSINGPDESNVILFDGSVKHFISCYSQFFVLSGLIERFQLSQFVRFGDGFGLFDGRYSARTEYRFLLSIEVIIWTEDPFYKLSDRFIDIWRKLSSKWSVQINLFVDSPSRNYALDMRQVDPRVLKIFFFDRSQLDRSLWYSNEVGVSDAILFRDGLTSFISKNGHAPNCFRVYQDFDRAVIHGACVSDGSGHGDDEDSSSINHCLGIYVPDVSYLPECLPNLIEKSESRLGVITFPSLKISDF